MTCNRNFERNASDSCRGLFRCYGDWLRVFRMEISYIRNPFEPLHVRRRTLSVTRSDREPVIWQTDAARYDHPWKSFKPWLMRLIAANAIASASITRRTPQMHKPWRPRWKPLLPAAADAGTVLLLLIAKPSAECSSFSRRTFRLSAAADLGTVKNRRFRFISIIFVRGGEGEGRTAVIADDLLLKSMQCKSSTLAPPSGRTGCNKLVRANVVDERRPVSGQVNKQCNGVLHWAVRQTRQPQHARSKSTIVYSALIRSPSSIFNSTTA